MVARIIRVITVLSASVHCSVQAVTTIAADDIPVDGNPALNRTAAALFDTVKSQFIRKYPSIGRALPTSDKASAGITLDFEVETLVPLKLTPDVLLLRGGIDLAGDASLVFLQVDSQAGISQAEKAQLFPSVSKWFEVGLDGLGSSNNTLRKYRQTLACAIEIGSVTMTPSAVLESSFLPDLTGFIDTLSSTKPLGHLTENLQIAKQKDVNKEWSVGHLQFTVGLPLDKVPELLSLAPDRTVTFVRTKVETLCELRAGGCSPMYKGLLLLSSWLFKKGQDCNSCGHPKRCVTPWLVRTHFGDMARRVEELDGPDSLKTLAHDIVHALGIKPDATAFPGGVVDYIKFPEMAELGSMVISRQKGLNSANTTKSGTLKDMPTTATGLRSLAQRMLVHRAEVDQKLKNRGCGIFGADESSAPQMMFTNLTAKAWVDAMRKGKDLLSDHDSPLSERSFSGLVWKSMSGWRMQEGSSIVHLECRRPRYCIPLAAKVLTPGPPSPRIAEVASVMQKFEKLISPA